MKRLMTLATISMMTLLATPVFAQHEGAAHGEAHAAPIIAVPHNTEWIGWLATGFVWLFIAAIILGPIALWIKGPERPEVVSHAAAGGHGHH